MGEGDAEDGWSVVNMYLYKKIFYMGSWGWPIAARIEIEGKGTLFSQKLKVYLWPVPPWMLEGTFSFLLNLTVIGKPSAGWDLVLISIS